MLFLIFCHVYEKKVISVSQNLSFPTVLKICRYFFLHLALYGVSDCEYP